MNSNDLLDAAIEAGKRYREYIHPLPLKTDGKYGDMWDFAAQLRLTHHLLEIIHDQVYCGERNRKEYVYYHEQYRAGKMICLDKGNTRATTCNRCFLPLEPGDGMRFEFSRMRSYLCIRCDPRYDHCPICDYPVHNGVCLGCGLDLWPRWED